MIAYDLLVIIRNVEAATMGFELKFASMDASFASKKQLRTCDRKADLHARAKVNARNACGDSR
jgi:hypothetical protein